ncbi:nucleotidyltransferase domain-containing protein [Tateyamaria sp. SN6-1]|uniref:nucleotidyltransferase domain-containing protein n=1 Tax=Tateyamaria sp. SN6-1 TaxID=3092148 RepID=UPI0039F60465
MTRLERRLADAVLSACAPVAVLMFGSRARGQSSARSDADLLVVVETAPHGLINEIRDALSSLPIGVDIVLRTPAQVRAETTNPAGFLSTILTGAIPLVLRDENTLEALLSKGK